jgi:hypothetical protein
MIIFYNKQTKDIFGVIDGRVFDNPELEMVKPEGMDENLIGRYIVPYKKKLIETEIPIEKWFIKNKKTMEVEKRIVGYKKEMIADGLEPDVSFADLILDFEYGRKNIYDYKIVLDKNESIIGFEIKV